MATPEIISLLCAGTVKYHAALGGRGAPLLTRGEIAGLLAGLPPEAMDLALAKYAGDHAAERLLVAKVRAWAAGLAVAEEWEIVRGRPTLCNMSALAVFEVVRPNVCGRCHGSGMSISGLSASVCRPCNGSGHKALATMLVADACGIPETSWRRHWSGRYERIFRRVQALDGLVGAVVRRDVELSV